MISHTALAATKELPHSQESTAGLMEEGCFIVGPLAYMQLARLYRLGPPA